MIHEQRASGADRRGQPVSFFRPHFVSLTETTLVFSSLMGNTTEFLCHLGYICVPTLNCVCPAFRGFFLTLVVTLWAVFSPHLLLCSLPSFRAMYSTFFWAQFLPTMGLLLTLSVVSLTLTLMHLFPPLPFFISRFLIKLLLLRKYFYLLSCVRTILSLSFPHRSSYSSLDFTAFPLWT